MISHPSTISRKRSRVELMKYLLDTNVLSEAVKTIPDKSVMKMFEKYQALCSMLLALCSMLFAPCSDLRPLTSDLRSLTSEAPTSVLNSLGWKPEISLTDGIKSTYNEYLKKSQHRLQ